jgi:general secretion pathway protein G
MRSGRFGSRMGTDGRRSETRRRVVVGLGISLVLLVCGVTMQRRPVEQDRNLFELRTVVAEYCFDKHKAPGTLREMVDAGYLRKSALDSVTANVIVACNENPYAEF